MDIIKTWLTYKLGLEIPKPDEFERGLANGVLIAEILRKYGILSDDEFISLRHNNSENTRFRNIQHIEGWLTGSGVKIKESDLQDIAMEKVGVGLKLLYELYMWFEHGPRTPRLPGEPPKGFEFGKDPSTEIRKTEIYDQREKVGSNLYGDAMSKDGQRPTPAGDAYTSYDRIEFPRKVVLQKPFVGSSEANQAQHLYFCARTLEVLKGQAVEWENFARGREHRLQEFQRKGKSTVDLFREYSTLDQFDAISIRIQQKAKAAAARDAKLRSTIDDMDTFDSAAILVEPECESDIPIYADGRGDQCEYENKIRLMKCKRLEEMRDEEGRSFIRKQILDRTTQHTPLRMEDVLGGLTKLPSAERLLAAFISRCEQEKDNFIQHSIYEAGQLQRARLEDLEKELRIQRQEEEFRQYAASEEANPYKSYDFVCRVLGEPDLIQKFATADATIKDMIERALKIKHEPPPPPPCTPTFTHGRHCKEIMHRDMGRILVCEDAGESGDPEFFVCRILPEENFGEQE